MGLAEQRKKSTEMASYMKKFPSQFPDSVRRPHNGCGRSDTLGAMRLGSSWKGRSSSTWDRGMVGGVLAARLGFGTHGIPPELLE